MSKKRGEDIWLIFFVWFFLCNEQLNQFGLQYFVYGLYGLVMVYKFCYQIKEKRFFFGKWFTVIFLSRPLGTFLRGLNMFTCRPTLIFLVRAPWGNTACTWGTTVLLTTPPVKCKQVSHKNYSNVIDLANLNLQGQKVKNSGFWRLRFFSNNIIV